MLHHLIQLPGIFPRRDRGAVEIAENPGIVIQGLGKAAPVQHGCAQVQQQRGHAGTLGLVGHGAQGLFDADTRADQGGQLPGQQGQRPVADCGVAWFGYGSG